MSIQTSTIHLYRVDLQKGWKVDFARVLINNFDRVMKTVPTELEAKWLELFTRLLTK